MTVYKALYKKMMDDLTDAEMWLDWANKIQEENEDVAKFLMDGAKYRVEECYPETMKHFMAICENDKGCTSMMDMVTDSLDEWYEKLAARIRKM